MSIVQKCTFDFFEECDKGFNCQKCKQFPRNRLYDKMVSDSVTDKIIDSNINFFQACIGEADKIFLTNMTEKMGNGSIQSPREINITISVVNNSTMNKIAEAFKKSLDMIGLKG